MLDGEQIIPRSETNVLHILFTSLFVYTFNYYHHHQRASVYLRPPLHRLSPLGHCRESTMSIIILPVEWWIQVLIALGSRTIPLM